MFGVGLGGMRFRVGQLDVRLRNSAGGNFRFRIGVRGSVLD